MIAAPTAPSALVGMLRARAGVSERTRGENLNRSYAAEGWAAIRALMEEPVEVDVWRAANLLVHQFGDEAETFAAHWLDLVHGLSRSIHHESLISALFHRLARRSLESSDCVSALALEPGDPNGQFVVVD